MAVCEHEAFHDVHHHREHEGDALEGIDACALREASGGGQEGVRRLAPRVRIERACPVKVL